MNGVRCPHGASCVHCRLEQLPAAAPPTPQTPRLLLTFEEAADALGVTYDHLVKLLKAAELDDQIVVGIGRGRKLRPATIDELVARHAERQPS